MDVQEEIKLFNRYTVLFPGDSAAVVGIASVHLAQQLERYISPSLDLGWVIRCILDINSENLFSNCRDGNCEDEALEDNTVHPEYKYAKFIIRLCELFLAVSEQKEITKKEASKYILTEASQFYYGEQLSELNHKLIELVCPNISTV